MNTIKTGFPRCLTTHFPLSSYKAVNKQFPAASVSSNKMNAAPAVTHHGFFHGRPTTPNLHHHHILLPTPIRRHSNSPFTVRMSLQANAPSLAVVGVTGAVGQEFLSVLSDRNFPYSSIKMLASKRSAGKRFNFEDKEYVVEELGKDSFKGVDIALFSAGGSISKEFGPVAVESGCVVVDNSSAFRMDETVPLVIPEVNSEAMAHIKLGTGKGALIANPNCSTIICLMAVTPLHRHAKVSKFPFLLDTHYSHRFKMSALF